MRYAGSRDGTRIAYSSSGTGPALVVVHGAPADHTRWKPLLPLLEPHVTVHAMDRRGRGGSGDGPVYAVEREYEDIAAVVDAVSGSTGEPVDVYGHSMGAFFAFGAATITSNIRRLVLYEGWPMPEPSVYTLPPELETRMDALMAAGDRDGVVEVLFRGLEEIADEDMAALKEAPSWAGRVAAAHTITREIRGTTQVRLEVESASRITVPVVLVTGEHSVDPAKAGADVIAKALPDARVVELEGQGHVADILAPEMFAARLLEWLHGER